MPSVSEIPNFFAKVRHPRRSRSVSVGPQSAADAREALAWRRELRKEKQASVSGATTGLERVALRDSDFIEDAGTEVKANGVPAVGSNITTRDELGPAIPEPSALPLSPNGSLISPGRIIRTPSQDRRENEKEEREMFSLLEKTRVRYDVEVITKLIVYSG